jgi:membrane-associated phospholipid phosphatase
MCEFVQTVSMSWPHAFEVAAALTVIGGAMSVAKDRRTRTVGAFAREVAMIGVLYGLWGLAGQVSGFGIRGAFARAHWIEHFEHDVFLPTEASLQHLILGHPLIVQAANLYYAAMHFTTMLLFLIWLFIRHRERYRQVRSVMALTTLLCLVVQLLPVAPPRMLPGIVDTGLLYHQSVYSNGYALDQLSTMPSVHVAWAVLVGFYIWRISPSRWRFIGPVHSVLMVLIVVVTGNHWWLDGIVAVLILILSAWIVAGVRLAWHRLRTSWIRSSASPDQVDDRLFTPPAAQMPWLIDHAASRHTS